MKFISFIGLLLLLFAFNAHAGFQVGKANNNCHFHSGYDTAMGDESVLNCDNVKVTQLPPIRNNGVNGFNGSYYITDIIPVEEGKTIDETLGNIVKGLSLTNRVIITKDSYLNLNMTCDVYGQTPSQTGTTRDFRAEAWANAVSVPARAEPLYQIHFLLNCPRANR